jgi:diguanylate cyclase (GGDEF)-like protein
MRSFVERLDAMAGISSATEYDRAVIGERFDALKRQLPWLYAIISVSLVCVQLVASAATSVSLVPVAAMLGVIAVRTVHMRRLRADQPSIETIRHELRKTFCVCALFFLAYALWTASLCWKVGQETQADIAVFAGIAAIGASCGLTGFPIAGRIPLLLLGIPAGMVLSMQLVTAHSGMGACLVILSLINLRLLGVRDAMFGRLISSRFSLEAEKARALEAEAAAITEKLRAVSLANSDPLTGVANRRGFVAALDQFDRAHKSRLGLIMLDLDGFKPINDTFGHSSGDAILVQVSERLKELAAEGAPVARLGGDEFAIVCECADAWEAVAVAERAIGLLGRPFDVRGRVMRISACAGISYEGKDDVTEAVRRADIALFDAKRSGRGSVSLFSEELEREVQRRTAIEQSLREPGLAASIELSFQPIFRLDTMELTSFEALARWRHPELGWIPPSEFIPITEQISVLDEISYDLLKRAARTAGEWPANVRLSFNLSPVELCSAGTASRILEIIGGERLAPARLQIEVTETALLADFELARCNLSTLGGAGVNIVLDDFGAGYSSISYLREMRFDAVKLDGSLIASTTASGGDSATGLALLRGVLALCRAMGQECVAEHIETDRQLQLLQGLGCRFGQGFGLSPPLSASYAAELAAAPAAGAARLPRLLPRRAAGA